MYITSPIIQLCSTNWLPDWDQWTSEHSFSNTGGTNAPSVFVVVWAPQHFCACITLFSDRGADILRAVVCVPSLCFTWLTWLVISQKVVINARPLSFLPWWIVKPMADVTLFQPPKCFLGGGFVHSNQWGPAPRNTQLCWRLIDIIICLVENIVRKILILFSWRKKSARKENDFCDVFLADMK